MTNEPKENDEELLEEPASILLVKNRKTIEARINGIDDIETAVEFIEFEKDNLRRKWVIAELNKQIKEIRD